ncbi:MAG: IS21 family transposase, partial [bacterium]
MRRCREILKLKYENKLTHRAIARACSVGAGTVSDYVGRAAEAGLSWPLPDNLDDAQLEAKLFAPSIRAAAGRVLPEWNWVHQELKRPGVTLQLLWEEYGVEHPAGYRYSGFCELYRRWTRKLTASMRQVHRAGEKAFIDYSGKRPFIVDRRTGEHIPVELFVGVLGASSYVYAEATPDQALPSWVGAHVRMLEFIGGCPDLFVPDNLKSGVTKACRYEPEVNRTYEELARHYGAAVVPARAGKPKDKGKVEVSVLIAQRWILASLRNRVFFSLAELNAAIIEKVRLLNERKMQKLGVSRRDLFERLDRPALKALPVNRYEMGEWKPCT